MIDTRISLEELNKRNPGTMAETIGLAFVETNKDYLVARIPVDRRTIQPLGLLNGGASAALAETVGSTAAYLSVDRNKFYTVGLEIKCNHIRSATKGWVYGKATQIHTGKTTHVWQIEIRDDENNLVCHSILTMAVLELSEEMKERFKDLFFKAED